MSSLPDLSPKYERVLLHWVAGVHGAVVAAAWVVATGRDKAAFAAGDAWMPIGAILALPLAQWVFLPVWGALSDRLGRRGVMALSLGLTCLVPLLTRGGFIPWERTTERFLNGMAAGGLVLAGAWLFLQLRREQRASTLIGLVAAFFAGGALLVMLRLGGFLAFGLQAAVLWPTRMVGVTAAVLMVLVMLFLPRKHKGSFALGRMNVMVNLWDGYAVFSEAPRFFRWVTLNLAGGFFFGLAGMILSSTALLDVGEAPPQARLLLYLVPGSFWVGAALAAWWLSRHLAWALPWSRLVHWGPALGATAAAGLLHLGGSAVGLLAGPVVGAACSLIPAGSALVLSARARKRSAGAEWGAMVALWLAGTGVGGWLGFLVFCALPEFNLVALALAGLLASAAVAALRAGRPHGSGPEALLQRPIEAEPPVTEKTGKMAPRLRGQRPGWLRRRLRPLLPSQWLQEREISLAGQVRVLSLAAAVHGSALALILQGILPIQANPTVAAGLGESWVPALVFCGVQLFFLPIWGALCDRRNRRSLLEISLLLGVVVPLFLLNRHQLWQQAIAAAFLGLLVSGLVLTTAYLHGLRKELEVGRALPRILAGFFTGGVLMLGVGWFDLPTVPFLGPPAPVWIQCLLALTAFVAVVKYLPSLRVETIRFHGFNVFSQPWLGFSVLRGLPGGLPQVAALGAGSMAMGGLLAALQAHSVESSPTMLLCSLASLVAMMLLSAVRHDGVAATGPLLAVAGLLATLSAGLLAVVNGLTGSASAAVVTGVSLALLFGTLLGDPLRRAHRESVGAALGAAGAVGIGGLGLGFAGGCLLAADDPSYLLQWVGAVGLMVALGAGLTGWRRQQP